MISLTIEERRKVLLACGKKSVIGPQNISIDNLVLPENLRFAIATCLAFLTEKNNNSWSHFHIEDLRNYFYDMHQCSEPYMSLLIDPDPNKREHSYLVEIAGDQNLLAVKQEVIDRFIQLGLKIK